MTMTRTARGRHSINRAGYCDDIFQYAEEIRGGVDRRYSGIAYVSDVRVAEEYSGWPTFSIEDSEDDALRGDTSIDCVICIDDDGSLAAQVFLVDEFGDDWTDVDLTATVNDDESVSTGDMAADVESIIGAIEHLLDMHM